MATTKRNKKENEILDVAEKLFSERGFEQTKMEDIASELDMSKGSIYFYLESKENLYMALIYRAMNFLNDVLYDCANANKKLDGKQGSLALSLCYHKFTEDNPFYYSLLLEYTNLIRSHNSAKHADLKMSTALKESIYFAKLQNIHNIPFLLIVGEISRGQKDGSIKSKEDPAMIYLTLWSIILGYSQMKSFAGSRRNMRKIFRVDMDQWTKYMEGVLENKIIV